MIREPFLPFANVHTFLVSARKVPKEADLRGAELIAPAIKAALLRIFRPASPLPLEHLNFDPVPHKNVPIFARQFGSVRREGYIREGAIGS